MFGCIPYVRRECVFRTACINCGSFKSFKMGKLSFCVRFDNRREWTWKKSGACVSVCLWMQKQIDVLLAIEYRSDFHRFSFFRYLLLSFRIIIIIRCALVRSLERNQCYTVSIIYTYTRTQLRISYTYWMAWHHQTAKSICVPILLSPRFCETMQSEKWMIFSSLFTFYFFLSLSSLVLLLLLADGSVFEKGKLQFYR